MTDIEYARMNTTPARIASVPVKNQEIIAGTADKTIAVATAHLVLKQLPA